MAPKGNGRKRNKVARAPPKDVVTGWANLRMNYGGSDQPGIGAFAHEFPLGLMNCQTDLSAVWSAVKRYKLSHVTARLEVPRNMDGEMFIGWNRTPAVLTQSSILTHEGYHTFQRRCDVVRVGSSTNTSSLTLKIPTNGWKQYLAVSTYTKYAELLNREILRYCYGSIIIGFTTTLPSFNLNKAAIGNLVQIKAVQEVHTSDVTQAVSSTAPERESSVPENRPPLLTEQGLPAASYARPDDEWSD